MKLREFFTNSLLIALAIAFLAHFSLIAKYKQVLVQELNLSMLTAEITLFIVIIGLGVFNIIKLLRR